MTQEGSAVSRFDFRLDISHLTKDETDLVSLFVQAEEYTDN
jgi:hypothetical protein